MNKPWLDLKMKEIVNYKVREVVFSNNSNNNNGKGTKYTVYTRYNCTIINVYLLCAIQYDEDKKKKREINEYNPKID